ncbi:MFS transporter [Clostridium lacusfryxellense]|uniref:MFS transporter n=1 Tax=Clostridium lacusfryxellense TaxID=205328 RepID=UPI001C0ABFE9|nr:MFS transporter [Clostridium lacusfryxellense]MBU3109998.1 MFS transporter [Clostridium lacusfryxellense]
MKEKKQKYLYILLYIVSYVSFSFGMTQFIPFLSKIGYDSMERGILLSSLAVMTIILQMIFGFLSDKYRTVKKFMVAALVIYAVAAYLFYALETQYFVYHMIAIGFSGGLINTTCGLSDAWILSSNEYLRERLSFIKAFGSIGWALGSLIIPMIIFKFGYKGAGDGILFLCIISIVIMYFIKDVNRTHSKGKDKAGMSDIKQLIINRKYSLLVFILFLMYCAVITNNIVVVDKMLILGATNLQIGYKWSIQSVIEIPTYLFGAYFLKNINHHLLLKISATALTIQFVLFGSCNSITGIIILSGFQMLTTPLLLITSKTLIYKLTSEKMKSTGQLFALSIFTGLSSLLVPICAGTITRYSNVNITLFVAAFLSAIAFVLINGLEKMNRY